MKDLFLVYRLEEDGSLLKEGAVRLSFGALRACSYKTKTEARQQGSASILFKGFIMVFVIVFVFVDSLASLGIAITAGTSTHLLVNFKTRKGQGNNVLSFSFLK